MTTEEINEIHAGGGGICPNCDVEMNQVIEGGIDRVSSVQNAVIL